MKNLKLKNVLIGIAALSAVLLCAACKQRPDKKDKGTNLEKFAIRFSVEGDGGSLKAEVDGAEINSGAEVEKGKTVIFTALFSQHNYGVKNWEINGVVNTECGKKEKIAITVKEDILIKLFCTLKYPEPDSTNMVTVTSGEVNFIGIEITYPLVDNNDYYKGVFVKNRPIKIKPYKIGKYEVSFKLWKEVFDWNEKEKKGYKFAKGQKGVQESVDENEPVTSITWRDCIIWCNAYTEKITGATEECVYRKSKSDITVLKDATKTSECDSAYFDENKNGYRLPTEIEWEYAARFQYDNTNKNAENYGTEEKPLWLTKLNSLSGAAKPCGYSFLNPLPAGETWETLRDEAARVAVFYDWWDGTDYKPQEPETVKTERVDAKEPNALGLHNMSGNVWELCWDLYGAKIDITTSPVGHSTGTSHSARGGSWIGASSGCIVGWRGTIPFFMDYEHQGFRLACSIR